MAQNKITKILITLSLPLMLFLFSSLSQALVPLPLFHETKISLYFHDQIGGPNSTVVTVTGPHSSPTWYVEFGTIMVIDDPVTIALDQNSRVVGRCQGTMTTSSLDKNILHVSLHVIFTNGEFNGSTLVIQGASVQYALVREAAIVSGTGKFRYAKGYGIFETVLVDESNGYSVERFDFTVQHPQIM